MREYLFRGKRKGDKEWQFGHLHIIEWDKPEKAKGDYIDYRILGRHNECSYVDPETVGQYTGLENMNGVKIFDGDIVMFHEKKYIVRREDEIPGGYWWSTAYILQEVGVDDYLSFEETVDEYCNEICVEVIGNIYDNPEILKEGGRNDQS